jgi:hypothetical protein
MRSRFTIGEKQKFKRVRKRTKNCKRRLLKGERCTAVGITREVNIDNFAVRVTIKTICVLR